MPLLAHHLGEDNPVFILIVNILQLYQPIILSISAVFGGVTGLILTILMVKEHRAISVIRKANDRDSFWSEGEIKKHCRLLFYTLYDCMLMQTFSGMKPFVTHHFYEWLLSQKPDVAEGNDILNPVEIIDTRILAGKDRLADVEDEVSVCLDGYFIRPVYGTASSSYNFPVEKKEFRIICHFLRQGQHWKLNHVHDSVTLLDLLATKSYFEH
jgi:hypothetical protein